MKRTSLPGRRLLRDRRGLALLEFALSLPLLLLLCLTGTEITNYIITRMQISQLALHLADNAARIGSGSQLQAKTISELDINDLLTGAGLQAGSLDLYRNGRVILSSLQEDPANPGRYRIAWQRCRGDKVHRSSYGRAGDRNLQGVGPGPVARQTIAPPNGAAMFVEVFYEYQPLVRQEIAPSETMIEFASMVVRDRRDMIGGENGVYQVAGVTKSSC